MNVIVVALLGVISRAIFLHPLGMISARMLSIFLTYIAFVILGLEAGPAIIIEAIGGFRITSEFTRGFHLMADSAFLHDNKSSRMPHQSQHPHIEYRE